MTLSNLTRLFTPRGSRWIASALLVAMLEVPSALAQRVPAPTAPSPRDTASASQATAVTSTSFGADVESEIADSGGLTADHVARRAVRTSPRIAARSHAVGAASAGIDRARAGFIPRIAYTQSYSRYSDPGSGALGTVVTAPGAPSGPIDSATPLVNTPLAMPSVRSRMAHVVSVTIPTSDYFGRTPEALSAAHAEERAAVYAEDATRADVALEARLLYWQWVRARLDRAVAISAAQQARAHVRDTQALVEVGTATRAELLRVEAARARAELIVTQADGAAEELDLALRVAMHEPRRDAFRIGQDPRAPLPRLRVRYEALVREALRHRSEPREIDARMQGAQAERSIARASRLPRSEWFADFMVSNPPARDAQMSDEMGGSWEVGMRMVWSPTDLFATEATARAADAQAERLAAERRAVEDAIIRSVRQAARAERDAIAAQRTAARSLTAAEESYRVRRELFREGRATATDLVDAHVSVVQARLDAIAASVDGQMARARLLHAVGRSR